MARGRIVSVKLPEELWWDLETAAMVRGTSMSEVMREAIVWFLANTTLAPEPPEEDRNPLEWGW